MRKRSEAIATKKPESFVHHAINPNDTITCDTCGDDCLVSDCSKRSDGTLECGACGAPLSDAAIEGRQRAGAPPKAPPATAEEPETASAAPKDGMIAGYCGECGAEWPFLSGMPAIVCGHMTAARVKDPSMAKKIAPPAGQRIPEANEQATKPRAALSTASKPTAAERTIPLPFLDQVQVGQSGIVLRSYWGEATFPCVAYGNFHVGPFMIESQVENADSLLEVSAAMRAKLRAMAEASFQEQAEWYEKSLDSIRRE